MQRNKPLGDKCPGTDGNANFDQSAQQDASNASSLKEVTLIETVTSFLQEHGASEMEPSLLRNLAEALSKRIDDTSPGTLEDITLNNSYNSFEAQRVNGGFGSPPMASHGRSIRELEEQMSSLQKENFNLKLRIYFLEENNHQSARGGAGQSKDPIYKQLIDAKIENEKMRQSLHEKTELLKEAARAITKHEEHQNIEEQRNQRLIEQLKQQLSELEQKYSKDSAIKSIDSLSQEKLQHAEAELLKLKEALQESEIERCALANKAKQIERQESERSETLKDCEAKIEELAVQNSVLIEKLKEQKFNYNSEKPRSDLAAQLADKLCELQDAEERLQERERIHEQACRTIQKLMQKLSSQEKEIKRLNQQIPQQLQKIENPSNEEMININATENRSLSDSEATSADSNVASLKQRVIEQEETIKKLQMEIKKKTANLQNLVNKELWEKNREVERLNKLVNSRPELTQSASEVCKSDLQKSFTESEYTQALERNKQLQSKVDALIQRLDEEQHNGNGAQLAELRVQLHLAQSEAESANKWRLECADVCGVLTNRLEELAGFLNSLLKHKDVLGVLAADRRTAMRRAVDRSLDLSKSLNMTLSINGTSMGDQSLTQLCNLSEILCADEMQLNRTFNSHEDIQAAANANNNPIEILRAENKALKRELEKRRSYTDTVQTRKERRSLPLTVQQVDNQSESEAWSEPDRKVSLARMGLEENSQSLLTVEQQITESDSEGQQQRATRDNSGNSISRHQDRSRHIERIAQLEQLIAQRDERILAVQCQLVDSDNRFKQEQLRVLEINKQLEKLQAHNEALQVDLRAFNKWEHHAAKLQSQLEQLQMAHNTLTADAQVCEMELEAAQSVVEQLQQQMASTAEKAEGELNEQREQARQELEALQLAQKQTLECEYIGLAIYEQQKQQLIELQGRHVECLRTLEYHQETERELKQALLDNELAARSYKKQLDESTLQASKAVMERSKAYTEKLQLEKCLEELKMQVQLLKEQKQKAEQSSQPVHSSDVSQSGYTSEEVPLMTAHPSSSTVKPAMMQRLNNSSPDLGIESDAGRVSSVELSNAQRALLKTVEMEQQESQVTKEDHIVCMKTATGVSEGTSTNAGVAVGGASTSSVSKHDCAKVDQENAELRRKLIRTKRAFEDTYEKLRLANQAKAQVEKDIKNQILKTHNVLRNVRSNMENEL